ncbi:MAG TPA: copper chaperone PCu(A)C [Steroidobacteraceae bacterium]
MTRSPAAWTAIIACALVAHAAWADAPAVRDAWARATPPGSDVAAVYLTLVGDKLADELQGASTPRAAMTHLHSMDDSGGMARMRAVEGLAVPAGKTVTLAPQGLHLMLMGLAKPLAAGERFPLTLHFAKGGDRTIEVRVQSATAAPPVPTPP